MAAAENALLETLADAIVKIRKLASDCRSNRGDAMATLTKIDTLTSDVIDETLLQLVNRTTNL